MAVLHSNIDMTAKEGLIGKCKYYTYGSTAISLSARILLGSVRTISDVTSNST